MMIIAPSKAFEVRRQNFADRIFFFAPGLKRYQTSEFQPQEPWGFVPISLTGGECALQCDHCQGQLLRFMTPVRGGEELVELCQRLAARGTRGVLLTGGSDSQGRVPLLRFADAIRRVKETTPLRVVLHTGLVDKETAQALAEARVDGAMLDIIGAEATLREVYHLEATPSGFEESLAALTEHGLPTVPHIVLGLHHGRFVGEEAALAMVSRYPIAALVLVVITPLEGTPMAGIAPPPARQIGRFFEKARQLMPQTPLLLGCARPMGKAKQAIDRRAVDAGLNGIAYPAEGVVAYAQKRGLQPQFREVCCSLLYAEVLAQEARLEEVATAGHRG